MRRPRRPRSNPKYPIRCQDGDYFLACEKCRGVGGGGGGGWRGGAIDDSGWQGNTLDLTAPRRRSRHAVPRERATPASANQVRHTSANARGNKSTDVSPGGYAEERHYLWSFVSVATVRKRVEPMRLGLCVAPRDSRHRGRRASVGEGSSPGPPWRLALRNRPRRVILQ